MYFYFQFFYCLTNFILNFLIWCILLITFKKFVNFIFYYLSINKHKIEDTICQKDRDKICQKLKN